MLDEIEICFFQFQNVVPERDFSQEENMTKNEIRNFEKNATNTKQNPTKI